MTILEQLAGYARERTEKAKQKRPLSTLRQQAFSMPKGSFAFENAIKKPELSFICECKKASPSRGQRICMNNVKVAGGVFWQDRYVAFLQAIVNLVVSVVMINKIGLPGVYVGTIVQGLISTIIKPIIVYKDLFKVSPFLYFKQGLGNLIVVVAAYIVSLFICNTWLMENTILNFVLRMLIVVIVPNLIFVGAYFRTKEFAYLKNTILRIVKRK